MGCLLVLLSLSHLSFAQVTFRPWGQPAVPFGQQSLPPFGQFGPGGTLPPFGQFGPATFPPFGQFGQATMPPFGQMTPGGFGGGMFAATTPQPPVGTPLLINSGAGPIQGLVVTEPKSRGQYGVFLGIPYAQPPVGNLRFQNPLPQPLPPSGQTVRATAYGKNCAAVPFDATTMSEDCLFLNIFTPKISQQAGNLLPVLLWIHGGALQMGSGNFDSISGLLGNIVSQGVVMVSINYRLGPFGFWTSRSQVAPGNYGFMDQSMAIKWVRSNIAAFGGDPQMITIAGQSAGGESVSAQTLSPQSNTLIKRAIIMSASLGVGEIFLDSWPAQPSMELAMEMGCWNNATGNDMAWRNALSCMKNIPVTRISDSEKNKPSMPYQRYGLRYDGTFLPRPIDELARSRPRMDVMVGTTKEEFVSLTQLEAMMGGQALVRTPEAIISASIPAFIPNYAFPPGEIVRKAAQYQYVELARRNASRPDASSNYWFNQDVRMKSAIQFWTPSFNDAKWFVQSGSNVYLYSWEFVGDKPAMPGQIKGAGHGSELDYIFDQPGFGPPSQDSARDLGMKQQSSRIWTQFVKTGRPTMSWTPLNLNDWNYFSLDYPFQQMKTDYHAEDNFFWTSLIPSLQSVGGGDDLACSRARQSPNMPLYWYSSTYCPQ